MSDGLLGKAATMEIPISSNGDAGSLPEDDGLEQVGGRGRTGALAVPWALPVPRGAPAPWLSPRAPPQDLQQVMVSGPNLNETSIVSGGYGGSAEGIIPTGTIKGRSGWGRGTGAPLLPAPRCSWARATAHPDTR